MKCISYCSYGVRAKGTCYEVNMIYVYITVTASVLGQKGHMNISLLLPVYQGKRDMSMSLLLILYEGKRNIIFTTHCCFCFKAKGTSYV